jgi:HK97 family phage portal protein
MKWYQNLLPAFATRTDVQSAQVVNSGVQKRSIMGGWEMLLQAISTRNKSGVYANQSGVLGLPAAFSCIKQISETCAVMPIHLHQRVTDSQRKYVSGHPVSTLLNKRANQITNSYDIRRDLIALALIFPSGYLWIERQKESAQPIALWLKNPMDVAEHLSADERSRFYTVKGVAGPVQELDIIRITNVFGKSVVTLLNEAFGTSMAAQSFAAHYFANNGNVVRYATTPSGTVNKTQRQNLESDLTERFGPNATDIPLLEYNIELKELTGLNMSNAQALETRKWQAEEVCRIFNMPPAKIGLETNARYNSIEQMDIEYLKRTILPWLTTIEQEFSVKLLTEKEKQDHYFQHQTAALLKTDLKTRLESYERMFRLGWSINEIRELEEYDSIDGGDIPFIQVNQIPLDLSRAYAEKLIANGEQPGADNNAKV